MALGRLEANPEHKWGTQNLPDLYARSLKARDNSESLKHRAL